MNKNGLWWNAPEYFSRWRLFPRAFISMYIYLLYDVVQWFMALPDPNTQQAGLVSVIVGAGAAWFGGYVNSTSSKFQGVQVDTTQTGSMSTGKRSTSVAPVEAEYYDDADTAVDEPVIIRRKRA